MFIVNVHDVPHSINTKSLQVIHGTDATDKDFRNVEKKLQEVTDELIECSLMEGRDINVSKPKTRVMLFSSYSEKVNIMTKGSLA